MTTQQNSNSNSLFRSRTGLVLIIFFAIVAFFRDRAYRTSLRDFTLVVVTCLPAPIPVYAQRAWEAWYV